MWRDGLVPSSQTGIAKVTLSLSAVEPDSPAITHWFCYVIVIYHIMRGIAIPDVGLTFMKLGLYIVKTIPDSKSRKIYITSAYIKNNHKINKILVGAR